MKNNFKKNNNIYKIKSPFENISIGTIGKPANTVKYTNENPIIRKNEKKLLTSVTAIESKNTLFLNQVHGDTILLVDSYPEKDMPVHGDADGFITQLEDICLVIRTADCVPVFIFDSANKVIGAAHSGWKGCRLKISQKVITMMKNIFGSENRDMHVFILPSIGPDAYEVNEDVAKYFENHVVKKGSKIYVNLQQSIIDSLLDERIPKENIFNSKICNYSNNNEFFSHRQGDKGRNLNFAYMG
ncbi:peptidoglycan editing factor PgeF [Spirochaetota bacterium]